MSDRPFVYIAHNLFRIAIVSIHLRYELVTVTQSITQSISAPASVTLLIQGMKCAGCVAAVEKQLLACDGVDAASVNLLTEKATVICDPEIDRPQLALKLVSAIAAAGFSAQVLERGQTKLSITHLETDRHQLFNFPGFDIVLALLLIGLAVVGHLGPMGILKLPILSNMYAHAAIATIALSITGREILWDGAKGLWHRIPNMNSLVGLGTVSAYSASMVALLLPKLGWHCFFEEPVMLLGFVLLGRALEHRARGKASAAIHKLMSLQPLTARVCIGDVQIPIAIEEVQVGDRLLVLPGEKNSC